MIQFFQFGEPCSWKKYSRTLNIETFVFMLITSKPSTVRSNPELEDIFTMVTRASEESERYSFKHWVTKLGVEGSSPWKRIDLLTEFIAAIILPRIAFYLDLKDHEELRRVRGHPQNSRVFAQCRDARARLTKTERETDYANMTRVDLSALAVLRVHACLTWAGKVVERSPGQQKFYPQFRTADRDEQFEICMGVLRLIQKHRKGRNTFSPNREEDWPYRRMQECIDAWKEQPNAVDFSQLDMTVALPWESWKSYKRRAPKHANEVEEEDEDDSEDLPLGIEDAGSDAKGSDSDDEEDMNYTP